MTFEEKWKELTGDDDQQAILNYNGGKLLWDAATYAANVRAGDAGNEAEKDARRKEVVQKIMKLNWAGLQPLNAYEALDAIIKEAQG